MAWLFLDMNSYFATVEQQERPELRGRPVGVAPVDADSTCLIAASYEAKRYGVHTLMNVGEARRKCPEMTIVLARPKIYIDYHQRILEVIHSLLPEPRPLSVDEFACRLWPGNEGSDAGAIRTAREMKRKIKAEIGSQMRCSVGLAPNIFLAKVAAELHKPDGLVLLRPEDLPGALLTLGLRGLPGIGARMHERLISGGIASIADLYAASADDLRKMWGGVVGARWWHMLRGSADADYPGAFRPTAQLSLSHSHVLAPALRTTEGAHRVLLRLAEKAATRLRKKELVSGAMYVSVRYQDETTRKVARWRSMDMHRTPSSDTTAMLRDMRSLWSDYVAESSGNRIPTQVGICLHRITSVRLVPLSLYDDDSRRQVISTLIDQVNCRFGPHRLEIASVQGLADFAGERIAFAKVSDDDRERHYQR